jgi:hypothetical protein
MMKGDAGSPIWIVVTLLLALVVGITMYQLLRKTSADKTFEDWMGEIGSGQAELTLNAFCEAWNEAGFVQGAVNENKLAQATAAASHSALAVRYFTEEEFNLGERLTACDCSVVMYQKDSMTKLDALRWYDPDKCHDLANEIAENNGLVR